MELYVGLDVSLDMTSVCVLDGAGKIVWRGRCSSTPDAIARVIREHAPTAVRIGLEAGQLSTWLVHGLRKLGLPAICLDARHAKAALSLQLNKTDDNDALGLAHDRADRLVSRGGGQEHGQPDHPRPVDGAGAARLATPDHRQPDPRPAQDIRPPGRPGRRQPLRRPGAGADRRSSRRWSPSSSRS